MAEESGKKQQLLGNEIEFFDMFTGFDIPDFIAEEEGDCERLS